MRSRCGSGDRICPLLLCALFAIQTLLQAQGGASGTIVGFVKDSTGAIIPKAAVSIRNLGTNLTQSDTTGESGEYSFSYIPPGNYEIRATKTGFRASVAPNVKLDTGGTFRVDISLQVGEVSESVEVQATAEHQVFDEDQFMAMIDLARQGLQSLLAKQQSVLNALTLLR